MKREAALSVLVVGALLVCASGARARLERAGSELARLRTAHHVADSTAEQIRGLEAALHFEERRLRAVREIPHALSPGVLAETALALAPEGVVLDRFALDCRSGESGESGRAERRFEVAIEGFASSEELAEAYADALRGSGLTDRVVVRRAGERAVRGRSAFDFALRFETPLDAEFELVASGGRAR